MTLDNIKDEIDKAKKIVILTHENPDGDAVGSSLAMYNAILQMGKNVDVIIPKFPKTFTFLKGAENIKENLDDGTVYDLGIALDCADTRRLIGYEEYYENAKVKISIDHHGSNTMFADYNYVDPVSPACAQTLVIVLKAIGVELTKEIGTCILTGIITDTGGFRYEGVSTETFEITASLIRAGVNVPSICKKVLETKTKANFELRKRIMDRLEFFADGKIVYTYITLEDEKEISVAPGDYEGIAELGRDIENVEVSIFAREIEGGVKVSIRSSEYVNASEVCSIFGGGGHLRAAGAIIPLKLEQVKPLLIDRVETFIH